ncbi:hypothetical protein WJX74_002545 [Apatococcus lobatus]|uniref:Uncharacterized protein n=1 Tax=Apatococcus lobatus TaxID=904363 RepID=A0AAW1Q5E0_9CHLO
MLGSMALLARLLTALCVLTSASIFAQQVSGPSSEGLLASAPGTPGDYTLSSGQYVFTVSPNISLGSYTDKAQAYFSGINGVLASAGSTSVFGAENSLITAQIPTPPYPLNITMPSHSWFLTDPFGGAACISYSFASNTSAAIVGVADADQLLDNNYQKSLSASHTQHVAPATAHLARCTPLP